MTAAELEALQDLWQATPEPSEHTRLDARARLFEAIAGAERVEPPLEPAPRRRRLRGRRVALVLALLVIVFVFLASVAVAFHLHVVLFGLAEKAPPPVVKTFAELDVGAPAGMASGVVPNETRRVGIFAGHTLWVAPTAKGGFCFVFSDDGGGCDSLGAMPLTVAARGIRESTGDQLKGIGVLSEVNRGVSSRWANAVEIRFQDGESIRPEITWVSSPIGVGFFLQTIPVEHRQPGHLVSEIAALDRDGNVVASENMSFGREPDSAPPEEAILDRVTQLASIDTAAGPVLLRRAPTRYDGHCTWAEFGNQVFRVVPCLPRQYEQQRGLAIAARSFGGRSILLGGCGYPAVELLHGDGSVRRVDCSDGVVFTALTQADASARLQAVNEDGRPEPKGGIDVATLLATSRPGQARPSPRRRKRHVNKKEGA